MRIRISSIPRGKRGSALKSADPVRFRTRQGGTRKSTNVDDFNPKSFKTTSVKAGKTNNSRGATVNKFPQKPEVEIYNEKSYYRIIIEFPYHKENNFEYKLSSVDKGEVLTIKSLLDGFNFFEEILLEEKIIPSSLKIDFNNRILNLKLKKK